MADKVFIVFAEEIEFYEGRDLVGVFVCREHAENYVKSFREKDGSTSKRGFSIEEYEILGNIVNKIAYEVVVGKDLIASSIRPTYETYVGYVSHYNKDSVYIIVLAEDEEDAKKQAIQKVKLFFENGS